MTLHVRFMEDGFDLDLSYITPRIIAMGFPSSNIEGLFRNPMEEVQRFFETRHPEHAKIFNLCSERQSVSASLFALDLPTKIYQYPSCLLGGDLFILSLRRHPVQNVLTPLSFLSTRYDPQKFNGRVAHMPFDDHNTPPIHFMPAFCQSAKAWLEEHSDNVVAVSHLGTYSHSSFTHIPTFQRHPLHFSPPVLLTHSTRMHRERDALCHQMHPASHTLPHHACIVVATPLIDLLAYSYLFRFIAKRVKAEPA